MNELDSKLNELAFRLGMSRQHKKLIKELLVELTQKCYHEGYHEAVSYTHLTLPTILRV